MSTDSRPVATVGCARGDAVAIVPIPAPGLDAPETVHGTVTRASETCVYVDGDGGERYCRRRSGRVERAVSGRTRVGALTSWRRIANDSELRRVEADGGTGQLEQESCSYCGTTSLSGCLPSMTIEVEVPEATSTFHRTACRGCVLEVLGDD